MTGTKDLFESICSMDNLYRAYQNAKKNKGWYQEVKQIEKRPFYYLAGLQYMLKEHLFHTSEYEKFVLKEGRKARDIYKLPFFPDRVAQWAILQVLEPFLIAHMTKDTYSAIPNRGIQPIVDELGGCYKKKVIDGKKTEIFIPSVLVSDPENTRYCYKIDIHHFYQSINHRILKDKYRKLFKDLEVCWILDEIIDSINTATPEDLKIIYPDGGEDPDTGIPIGNYLSQYSGNFYLSDFDHWLKEECGVKYLYRYMDDIVILDGSKEFLWDLHGKVVKYLRENLRLELKGNYQIFPSKVRGIDFVGYRFFGEYTLLRKSTAQSMKRKLLNLRKKLDNGGKMTYGEWCSYNSYTGWLGNCNGWRLCVKYCVPLIEYMVNYYKEEVMNHGGKLYECPIQYASG